MSLAPASSLGAFLKARFAVKGVQWAGRSFGTLTAAGRGLLSSMGASCVLGCGGYRASYQLRCDTGTPPGLFFRSIGRFEEAARRILTDRPRRSRTPAGFIFPLEGGVGGGGAPHPHRAAAPIQNPSPSESSVSSHNSGNCG